MPHVEKSQIQGKNWKEKKKSFTKQKIISFYCKIFETIKIFYQIHTLKGR